MQAELGAGFFIAFDVFRWSFTFVWRQCRFRGAVRCCQLLEVLQGEWAYSEAVLLLSTWHCC